MRPTGCVLTNIAGCEVACTQWPDPSAGCRNGPPVEIFASRSVYRMVTVREHENGHAFDCEVDRLGILRLQFAEIDGRVWTTPASEERLAQWYALCRFNRRLARTFRSTYYSFVATPAKHLRVCALIRRVSALYFVQ